MKKNFFVISLFLVALITMQLTEHARAGTTLEDDQFEDNDSLKSAVILAPGYYENMVVKDNDTDWYELKVTEPNASFEIVFDHGSEGNRELGQADIDAYLYNESGQVVAEFNSHNNREYISFLAGVNGLSPGSYKLHIYVDSQELDSREGIYSLILSFSSGSPTTLYDDSLEENDGAKMAYDIKPGVYQDLVVKHDDEDWYQFTVADPNVMLFVNFDRGSSGSRVLGQAELSMELYNSTGELVDTSSSTALGENLSFITGKNGLSPDTYDLRIYVDTSEIDSLEGVYDMEIVYSESIAPTLADDLLENNDHLALAHRVSSQGYSNLIVKHDDEDWYEFEVDGSSVTIELSFVHGIPGQRKLGEADLDMELFDSSGVLIQDADSTTDSEKISVDNLVSGATYRLRVYVYPQIDSLEGQYNMELNFIVSNDISTLAEDRYESNDFPEDARKMASGSYDYLVVQKNNDDWYEFTALESEASIRIYFTHGFSGQPVIGWADLDIKLFDDSGNLIAKADTVSNNEYMNVSNLVPGETYRVRVYVYKNSDCSEAFYSLEMDFGE